MLNKHKVITKITTGGVVGIIRTDTAEQAQKVTQACVDGGVNAIEVTFTVDGAHRIIENLATSMPDVVIGAGTVLDAPTARIAILSGSQFIVGPTFNREVAMLCNRYATPYMAGCCTPTEMVTAMEYGVEIIKLFPALTVTPDILSAILPPLPQANFMPTGGVNLQNAAEWVRAGAVALGVGGDLVAGGKTGDYNKVTEAAKKYVQVIAQARQE